MFKIESYITPIILNHVDKYVKDFRPQDSSLSLWDGDVIFQNLDLKTDVLESDFRLKFEFLSGHIHELTIHVPWTKITSEPIVVTINTIEFVIKLKRPNHKPAPKTSPKKEKQKSQNEAPGFIPGLVSKILNNIVVNCHNIIFKWVEDDIVVSLNVQHLSFGSANSSWEPDFIEVSPIKVLLRKLIKCSDLTICLDKRNSEGQIDVCQEPILYRCSLEIRYLESYNALKKSEASTVHISVFIKLMEINLSTIQIPMFMKLMKIIESWQEEIANSESALALESDNVDSAVPEETAASSQSYFQWIWGMVPNFSEETEQEVEELLETERGHVSKIGVYIETANINIKQSEFVVDTILGTSKKIKYDNIFRLTLLGIFCELLNSKKLNWLSFCGGVSRLDMEVLDAFADDIPEENTVISTATTPSSNYFGGSLFDEKARTDIQFVALNIDSYRAFTTDTYLIERCPGIVLSSCIYKEEKVVDEGFISRKLEIVNEQSPENSELRILVKNPVIKINTPLYKVIDLIQRQLNNIKPGSESAPIEKKLHPPLQDDFDSLMINVPVKISTFCVQDLQLELSGKTFSKRQMKEFYIKSSTIPRFVLKIDSIDGTWSTPLDIKKLVHTTCQLPDKPEKLLKSCYNNFEVNVSNFQIYMTRKWDSVRILNIPDINAIFQILLLPELWTDSNLHRQDFQVDMRIIQLQCVRPQFLTLLRMVDTLKGFNADAILLLLRSSATNEMFREDLEVFEVFLANNKISFQTSKDNRFASLNIENIEARLSQEKSVDKSTIFKCKKGTNSSFLAVSAQIPIELEPPENVMRFSVLMSAYVLELNHNILSFFDYTEKFREIDIKEPSPVTSEIHMNTSLPSRPALVRRASRRSLTSDRGRKISHPEETIHYSSERDERVEVEIEYKKPEDESQISKNVPTPKLNIWKTLKKIGIQFDLSSGDVLLVSKDLNGKIAYSTVVLPDINLRSSNTEKFSTFPWTITIKDFALLCRNEPILRPLQTTITIALNHKTELYTQKKYDNFETIDEDDSSRRGSRDSKKHKKKALSDEATGGDITETESLAPAKRKVQLERDIVTVNLHVDTSPINAVLSVKCIPVFSKDLEILSAILKAMGNKNVICDEVEEKPPDHNNIKEFLEYESNSESSKNIERVESKPNDFVFSLLLQWTITKFTLEVEKYLSDSKTNQKIILEIEDIITTFDKRTDYYKFTNKIGIFQIKYYKKIGQGDYLQDKSLNIKMRADLTQSPFFNLILTNVALKNYFEKIGAKKTCTDGEKYLSEIVVNMRALEIIVDIGMLKNFLPTITKTVPSEEPQTKCPLPPTTAKDLPMVYFDCKGLAIYLPDNNLQIPWCSALLLKISNIKISSNPENPLQRSPIRTDLYNKAAQMGMLFTPGSMIEDRQYEVHFKDISATTCNWSHVLNHFKDAADTHNTNPAFEWNNQGKKAPIELRTIFTGFNFLITYAPCIDYQNVLVCGEILEFNCTNDFLCELTVDQIFLMYILYNKYGELMSKLFKYEKPTTPTKLSKKALDKNSMEIQSKPKDSEIPYQLNSDSGVFTTVEKIKQNVEHKATPSTLTFVSGIFSIRVFQCRRVPISKDSAQIQEILDPLIAIKINQPSLILSKTFYEEIFQVCVFNIGINVGNLNEEEHRVSTIDPTLDSAATNKFPLILIETRKATLDHSGIPAPLITFKRHTNKIKKVDLSLLIQKPIFITISQRIMKDLMAVTFIIAKPFLQNVSESSPVTETPILRGSKIQLMKKLLLNADSINVKLTSISLKFVNKSLYNILLVATDLNSNCKFNEQQDKFITKISIGAFHIRSSGKMVLHPVNLKSNVELIQEQWQQMPLCIANVKFNVFQIDLDVENIRQVMSVTKDMNEQMENLKELLQSIEDLQMQSKHSNEVINLEKLERVSTPTPSSINNSSNTNKSSKIKIEYYQDDLRAGAFQFIEMTTDKFLPLPYQIQIIKKHFGILCWRYPQPRIIDRIRLFPIPISTSADIKCRMEYFSESHQAFLHFCDFTLSEIETKEPVIPKDSVTANIWRVVILQPIVSVNKEIFDGNDEDSEVEALMTYKIENFTSDNVNGKESFDSNPLFDPKILVGCMRIDTSFNPSLIPLIQFLVSCNRFEVNLQNYNYPNSQPPPLLKKYKLTSNSSTTETLVTAVISNANFFWSLKAQKDCSIYSNVIVSVKCLDNAFMSVLNFIEDMPIESYLNFKSDSEIDVNVIANKIGINIGPSIIQTLMTAVNHWQSELKTIQSQHQEVSTRKYTLTKFTIVNRTNINISFGQSSTYEKIILQPQEFVGYSFLSDYFHQQLTFYISNENNIYESEPVSINFEGKHSEDSPQKVNTSSAQQSSTTQNNEYLQYVKIGETYLIVKIRKLSSTQMIIFLKGQLEIVSMVNDVFKMQLKVVDNKTNNSEIKSDFRCSAMQKMTVFEKIFAKTNVSLRFKFDESKSRNWTGDIPLKSNKSLPWFVKVPIDNDTYCSYWVRIIREDLPIDDITSPQKVLVVIWPIFEIRSMLSYPIKCIEKQSNQVMELNAAGGSNLLKTQATHQTEHELYFFDDERNKSGQIASFNLSLKAIDWRKFFWFDEQEWTIENCLTEFAKPIYNKWPYHENGQHVLAKRPVMSSKNVNHLVFKCSPSRELSCTLSLELAPWGMFINSTTESIRLNFKDPQIFLPLESNAISMIPDFKNGFYIEVKSSKFGNISSAPIYSERTNAKEKDFFILTEGSSLTVSMKKGKFLCRFLLEIKFADNKNVIFLKSPVIITNYTNHNLKIYSFCTAEKEIVDLRSTFHNRNFDENFVVIPRQEQLNTKTGFLLNTFFDCLAVENKRNSNTKYLFYLALKSYSKEKDDENLDEIPMPIFINYPFDRKCLSISINGESTALAVSAIVHENLCYINIFEDPCPAFEIYNETNLNFFIAQSKSSGKSKVTEALNETDCNSFVWNQAVRENSYTVYTPPEVYRSFPTLDQSAVNLTLALNIESNSNTSKPLRWSKIIETLESGESFVNIPWFGNIKVVICNKHRTKKIALFYISEKHEFCVKDLRSRILLKTTSKNNLSHESIGNEDQNSQLKNSNLRKEICQHIQSKNRIYETKSQKTVINTTFFVKEFSLKMFQDGKTTDYLKQEIIAIYIDELFLAYKEMESKLQIVFTNIQIDNQLFPTGDYDFQVIFCSKEIYPREERYSLVPSILLLDNYMKETVELSAKQFPLLTISLDFYENSFSIRKVFCKANQIRIYIEDTYVTRLLDFIIECTPNFAAYQPTSVGSPVLLEKSQAVLPYEVINKAITLSEPFHLETLNIQALSVLLSVHTCVRLYIALDHSPLEFAVYERKNVFSLPMNLGYTLGMHYLSGAIFGAGWVVGSLEILGSPSGFARSLTVGLKDFVSLPVQGLFRGPWGFVLGVTQGSASLLKNVTAGTVNSVTKLASSVARNLDRLTLDEEHIQRTESMRRLRPQGLAEGLTYGLTGLGISILGAIGGIARHTLNAKSPGQIVAGVGKGIVGVLAKPISGAAELVALTGQGVLHTVGFNEMPHQRMATTEKNVFTHPSNSTILKLLPEALASDQILFAHEAVIMVASNDSILKKVMLYMTSTVFAFLENDKPSMSAVVQLDKIEAKTDDYDPTILRIYIQDTDKNGEEADFTKRRIMQFLQSYLSETDIPRISTSSLEDVLRLEHNSTPDSPLVEYWTFYLNPNLVEYFMQYLKIIHSEIK